MLSYPGSTPGTIARRTCGCHGLLASVRPMRRAAWLLTLAGAMTAAASGCSSKTRRDQNYGSNVGADYHAPEAGPVTISEAGAPDRPDAATSTASDAGQDTARDAIADVLAETAARD